MRASPPLLLPLSLLPLLLAGCPATDAPDGGSGGDSGGGDNGTADSGSSDSGSSDSGGGDSGDSAAGLVCGDGRLGGAHEECDGDDDDACPGACSDRCQCPALAPSDELALHVIDVWQGDGMLLTSPAGFAMLVDAGDESEYTELRAHLREAGVEQLDYTLVSHQHVDHMGAMDLALDMHPEVGVAFDSGGWATSGAFEDYRRSAGDRRTTLEVGDTIDMGPGVTVEVVHAYADDTENENNNSVVLRVTHGDVSFLLGGDCESEVCEAAFDPGPIDVYKVHHHGSSDSSSTRLLNQMHPSLALISCGEGNSYGHPHGETLARLDAVGAEVRRTDEEGSIVVHSDGQRWTVTSDADP